MSDVEDLARKIKGLEDRIGARNATQLDSSTIDVGAGDSLVVSDVMADAAEATAVAIPGLQEALDLNEARLQDNAEAVQVALDAVDAALDAADAAEAAGIAAGEEASAAAADALDKAQEALDAAAAAGGGATYSGTAPTAGTAGVPGQQWFVWDSNYHVTGYYVYNGATSTWVQTVLDDGTFGNLSAARLTSGFIDAARIAAGSLTAAVLAADTITSREIAADAILARNIKAAEITGDKVAARTIAAGNIVAKTITAGEIAAGTITAGEIKAGTITANEIAAGTITATQINLDSLNGKTITGALIKSAVSGQRLEIKQTRIDFYSATSTSPVGYIFAEDRGSFSSVTIQNFYGAEPSFATFDVPRNPTAGAYESTRKLNLNLSHGLSAPVIQVKQLFGSGDYGSRKYPVIDSTLVNGSYTGMVVNADEFRLGTNDPHSVIARINGTAGSPTSVQVTADAFVLPDGTSLSADSGWLTPTVTGAGVAVNTVRYRKIGQRVEWAGQMNRSSGIQAGAAFSIPAEYAPSMPGGSGQTRRVISGTATTGTLVRFAFYPNGNVEVLDISGSATYAIFDGITYLTT